jgi:hypothetical protein
MESLKKKCEHGDLVARLFRASAACIACVLGGLACDGGSGIVTIPTSFDPKMLDFGTVSVGTTANQMSTLRNVGSSNVTIMDVQFNPSFDVYSARLADGETLRGAPIPSSGQIQVIVYFAPTKDEDDSTSMNVVLDHGTVSLPIHAIGHNPGPPMPVADPSTIAFADTEIGRDVSQIVRLTNQGEVDGVLREIRPKSASAQDPFSVTAVGGGSAVPSPTIQAHGASSIQLEVHFQPTSMGSFQQDLELIFDGGQSATITVSGRGVPAGQLQCTESTIAFGSVARGTTAQQPVHCTVSGGQYTLDHIALAPGSAMVFSVPNAPASLTGTNTLDFQVDLQARGFAQTYTGTLEVVGANGSVVQISLTGDVVPPPPGMQDLTVTLTWNTNATDFDLHIVRSGSMPFVLPDDCYWGDKNPDWGAVDNPSTVPDADDPFLDRDNTTGYGPENFNLAVAAEQQYDVYVHWYNYTVAATAVTAMIQFQLRGGAVQTYSQMFSTCGSMWHVGTFHMGASPSFQPDSTVTNQWKSRAAARCQ